MGLLNKSYFYTAGNLQSTGDGFVWREQIEKALAPLGLIHLSPNKDCFVNQVTESPEDREKLKNAIAQNDWDFVHKFMSAVIKRDTRMVDLASFIICNIEPDYVTYGTTHEVVLASLQFKPVLFHITDKSRFPLWFAGLFGMDLVFDNWDSLTAYIEGIDNGTIYANPKYWKILREEYR